MTTPLFHKKLNMSFPFVKATLLYLTGVYSTSASMTYLRTLPRLRYTFGMLDDEDIFASAVLWPLSLPFITVAMLAVKPMEKQLMKDELEKKKKSS